jgi:hypothetical protein
MSADERYDRFAARLTAGAIITDPWLDGSPRFRADPVVLPAARWRALARAGEELAALYDELCAIVADEPSLLEDFFALTPVQRALWLTSQPLWHGIARADVFVTAEGLAVTSAWASSTATEFTEDLSMVRLYKRWLEERGHELVLGSPYNLGHGPSGLDLFDRPFSIMLRHYKTDWWGERAGVWSDETIPDTEPLSEALDGALTASSIGDRDHQPLRRRPPAEQALDGLHVGAHPPLLAARRSRIIERIIPSHSRLETHARRAAPRRARAWVLKSDYGAEGDEVMLGRSVTHEVWRRASLARLARAVDRAALLRGQAGGLRRGDEPRGLPGGRRGLGHLRPHLDRGDGRSRAQRARARRGVIGRVGCRQSIPGNQSPKSGVLHPTTRR